MSAKRAIHSTAAIGWDRYGVCARARLSYVMEISANQESDKNNRFTARGLMRMLSSRKWFEHNETKEAMAYHLRMLFH